MLYNSRDVPFYPAAVYQEKCCFLFKNYDEGWVAAHKKEVVAEWNKHLENSRQ